MELHQRLKMCREAGGVTQREMADACGLTKNYISALERGLNKCNAHTLIVYAEQLGISVDALIGRDETGRILPDLLHELSSMDESQQRRVLQLIKIMR